MESMMAAEMKKNTQESRLLHKVGTYLRHFVLWRRNIIHPS